MCLSVFSTDTLEDALASFQACWKWKLNLQAGVCGLVSRALLLHRFLGVGAFGFHWPRVSQDVIFKTAKASPAGPMNAMYPCWYFRMAVNPWFLREHVQQASSSGEQHRQQADQLKSKVAEQNAELKAARDALTDL